MAEARQPANSTEIENSQEDDTDVFNDVKVARSGINMLLNNHFDDAFKLFQSHKYCYLILTFVYIIICV